MVGIHVCTKLNTYCIQFLWYYCCASQIVRRALYVLCNVHMYVLCMVYIVYMSVITIIAYSILIFNILMQCEKFQRKITRKNQKDS